MADPFTIPATLSIDEDDPRYRADWRDIGPHLTIAVDGEVQHDVTTYDTVEGIVIRADRRDGRLIIVDDKVVMKTVRGEVTVTVD